MALPGEITGGVLAFKCSECGIMLPLAVCKSAAGYYLGYNCPECGPYGRESVYFPTHESAAAYLSSYCNEGNTDKLRD